MSRTLAAARMFTVNPLVSLAVPWAIVLSSFAINLAIWGFTSASDQPGGGSTGGLAALYITMAIVFAQSVTQLLPYAMGVSITRRAFYVGTALVAAVQALGSAIVLTVLDAIENATGGWGVHLNFWAPGRMDVGNVGLQVLVFAAPMFLAAALGAAFGVAYKRFGQSGVWTVVIASILVLGGLSVLITWRHGWTSIGSWLVDSPVALLAVALPLGMAVVAGALGYAGIRRVVP